MPGHGVGALRGHPHRLEVEHVGPVVHAVGVGRLADPGDAHRRVFGEAARHVQAAEHDGGGPVGHRAEVVQAQRVGHDRVDHVAMRAVPDAAHGGRLLDVGERIERGVAVRLDRDGREVLFGQAVPLHVGAGEDPGERRQRQPVGVLRLGVGQRGDEVGRLPARHLAHPLPADDQHHVGHAGGDRHVPALHRRGPGGRAVLDQLGHGRLQEDAAHERGGDPGLVVERAAAHVGDEDLVDPVLDAGVLHRFERGPGHDVDEVEVHAAELRVSDPDDADLPHRLYPGICGYSSGRMSVSAVARISGGTGRVPATSRGLYVS